MLSDEGLNTHRDAYCDAIRALHAEGMAPRLAAAVPDPAHRLQTASSPGKWKTEDLTTNEREMGQTGITA